MIDDQKLAQVQAAMLGEIAPEDGFDLDTMTHDELRELRDEIDRRLPEDKLSQMDLTQELMTQYRRVQRLQESVIDDQSVAANQRSQVAGQVASTLQQMVKMQTEFHNAERFRAIENLLIKSLKLMPLDVAEEFIAEYERLGGDSV
jgi:hypothetical protein